MGKPEVELKGSTHLLGCLKLQLRAVFEPMQVVPKLSPFLRVIRWHSYGAVVLLYHGPRPSIQRVLPDIVQPAGRLVIISL